MSFGFFDKQISKDPTLIPWHRDGQTIIRLKKFQVFLMIHEIFHINLFYWIWILNIETKWNLINPFTTTDAYVRQHFHCLQWYAGSERVN